MVSDGGNILNLARFRKISRDDKKTRDRKQKEEQAAANRVRFGRSGAEKKARRLESRNGDRKHEGNRLEKGPGSAQDEPEEAPK